MTANINWVEYDPTWSPDGRYIAYSANQGPGVSIYRANVYGTPYVADPASTLLVERIGGTLEGAWSPDGRFIAFSSIRMVTIGGEDIDFREIYLQALVPLDNSNKPELQMFVGNDTAPTPPPPVAVSGQQGMHIRLTHNQDRANNTDTPLGQYSSPSWSPDMKHLAIASNIHECLSEDYGCRTNKIHILNLNIPFDLTSYLTQPPSGNPPPIPVEVSNYRDWAAQPFTAHGFWISFGGASWSPYVQCPGLEGNWNALLTSENKDFALRKACLLEYKGIIFYATFHETSENDYLGTNELDKVSESRNLGRRKLEVRVLEDEVPQSLKR